MKVYMCSGGGTRYEMFEGTEQECVEFYNAYDGSYKDENDFVWDMDIE